MSLRGVIVVFAKAPRPGEVKTRMCPPLQPEEAAQLYAHLLADVVAATAAIAQELLLEPVLAVHPADARPSLALAAARSFRVVRQRGAGLAERMDWAVREGAAAGARCILLRGSDSPLLDRDIVAGALAALEHHDIAVCPDRDGGYSLLSLRRPVRGLFAHPMSTASVLEDTLANARAQGLRAQLSPPSFDLDTAEDLRWLARARAERPGETERICGRTLAFADSRDLWRFAGPGWPTAKRRATGCQSS